MAGLFVGDIGLIVCSSARSFSGRVEYGLSGSVRLHHSRSKQVRVIHYRAYQISPDGRIQSGVDLLNCRNDEAATKRARQLVDLLVVELWRDAKMIARLEAKK